MAALLDSVPALGGGSAPAAVRIPAVEISFGSGTPEDWADALVSVTVEAAVAPAVDAVEVVLAERAGVTPAVGDTGSVALGYDDDGTEPVFAGSVLAVRRSVTGATRVTAVNGGAALARLRLDRSYEQGSAGKIVSDLAGAAGADTGSVDDGPDLAFYAVHSGRSAWAHVAALATLSGFAARFATGGGLDFGPYAAGAPVQTFGYAEDVLSLEAAELPPSAGAVTVIGEGAAGTAGTAAWGTLVKDPSPVTAQSGSGDPERLVRAPGLRSAAAARGAAAGIADAGAAAAATAELLVAGAPKAAVGAAVAVSGTPDGALDGTYVVRGLRHRYGKREGFTTLLRLARSGGGLSQLGDLL
jgi:hypothetical protein